MAHLNEAGAPTVTPFVNDVGPVPAGQARLVVRHTAAARRRRARRRPGRGQRVDQPRPGGADRAGRFGLRGGGRGRHHRAGDRSGDVDL
ncbi:hypothetical protein [Pseudonocardia sp. H11422]|uniref:hypothetical protein n=1 Tax=Pseudonocardia sp. H11422 TaxID=2835866 RepID=UPI003977E269